MKRKKFERKRETKAYFFWYGSEIRIGIFRFLQKLSKNIEKALARTLKKCYHNLYCYGYKRRWYRA